MMKTLTLVAAFALAFIFSPPVKAMVCFDPIDGRENFYSEYQEKEIARGSLGSGNDGMLLLANQKTGSWTLMIVRRLDGFLCPLASGEKFKLKVPEAKGHKIKWTR